MKCAAFELPFTTSEEYGRHNRAGSARRARRRAGSFTALPDPDGEGVWQWTNESYPADAVSLRSISSDNFVVVDTTHGADVIGETSFNSGPSTLHEKAIYIVEGALYQVEKLDFEGRKAYVRQIDCDYYTDAITYTKVTVLDTFDGGSQRIAGLRLKTRPTPIRYAAHGEVHVSSRVVGFKKIKFYTNENVGSGELDLPEQQMHTTAYWLTMPRAVMAALPYAADDRRDGVVGLSFAMRQVAQLLLMCDRQDIGISIGSGEQGEQTDLTRRAQPARAQSKGRSRCRTSRASSSTTTIRAASGFSEPLFRMHDELLARTRELIAGCECQRGCPTCVGPVGNTGPLAKRVALRILELLHSGAITPALTA